MLIAGVLFLGGVLTIALSLRGLIGVFLASIAMLSAGFLLRGVVLLFGERPHPSPIFAIGLIGIGVVGFVALLCMLRKVQVSRPNA
jgi:hypothetical protein